MLYILKKTRSLGISKQFRKISPLNAVLPYSSLFQHICKIFALYSEILALKLNVYGVDHNCYMAGAENINVIDSKVGQVSPMYSHTCQLSRFGRETHNFACFLTVSRQSL